MKTSAMKAASQAGPDRGLPAGRLPNASSFVSDPIRITDSLIDFGPLRVNRIGNTIVQEREETMKKLVDGMKLFWRVEDGTTATEYGVMLGLIIVVAMVSITVFGERVSGVFSSVHEPIGAAGGGS